MPYERRYGIIHSDGRRTPARFLTREAAQREAADREGADVYETIKNVTGRPLWDWRARA